MVKKLIAIGGAPGTQKSTLATNLSKKLGIRYISTDEIRTFMQILLKGRESEFPALFDSVIMTAEEYFKKYSSAEAAENEFRQIDATLPGIQAFLRSIQSESFIIEGVAITPKTVNLLSQEGIIVTPLFLHFSDIKYIEQVISSRGLWDDANLYEDWIKPLEVEWVSIFNNEIKSQAKELNLNLIDINQSKNLLGDTIKLLNINN